MSDSYKKNLHWLVFGLILVVAWFGAQALVTHFVPTANYVGPLSINVTGEANYSKASEKAAARVKAFNDAKTQAEQTAVLAGKSLNRLTYISESTMPAASAGDGMGADMSQTSPEASPGAAMGEQTITVNLGYELK